MSRRRIEDYIGVFQRILEILPSPPSVQQVILDFESAVWTALRFVLPNVSLHGCGFHFSQAVYRNIQSCSLATDYNNDPSINSACRSLLALKYIPAAKIKKSFDKLTALPEHGVIDPRLKKFYEYFDRQWIKNTVFPPSTWSIFNHVDNTNNRTEGWHNRIRIKANETDVNFYKLSKLLHDESGLIPLTVTLLNQQKLVEYQRAAHRSSSNSLSKFWDDYNIRLITTEELIEKCSMLTLKVI